jgi:hypothetical protein
MKLRNVLVLTVLLLALLPHEKSIERLQLLLTRRCPDCLLSWQEFVHVDLSGADLRNTNLRGSRFVDVDLTNADLRGADLRGAYFEAVTLRNTNLCGAIMMDGQKSTLGCWQHPLPFAQEQSPGQSIPPKSPVNPALCSQAPLPKPATINKDC